MATISSSSHYPTVGRYSGADRSQSGDAKQDAGQRPLTDGERFTQEHAHLSASEYIFAKLAFSEQQSAERLASGEADHTFSVRMNDRVFTIAGTMVDGSVLRSAKVKDAPMFTLAYAHAYAETEAANSTGYDFSDMSRQEIADAGKELFAAGKITLDDLFLFEHPDGVLRVDTAGQHVALNPEDRIDFAAQLRKAIQDMEQAGDYLRADSRYSMTTELLNKLSSLI